MANRKQGGLVGRAAKQQAKKYVKSAAVANPFVTVCVIAAAIGTMMVTAIVLIIVSALSSTSPTSLPPGACGGGSGDLTSTGPVPVTLHFGGVRFGGRLLNPQQKSNALTIVGVVKARGLSRRDAKVTLMSGYQESSFIIVNHGDLAGPDSRGLFQQRAGWGPLAVRMSAVGSTNLFLNALVKVPDRDSLSLIDEAMQVQHPSLAAYTSPRHSFMSWEAPVEQLLGNTYDTSVPKASANPTTTSTIPTVTINDPTVTTPCVPVVTIGDYGPPLQPMPTTQIGCPFQGTHTFYKNWQSANAVDLPTPIGTPVLAVADGVIGPRIGAFNTKKSNLLGLRLTLETAGNDFYYMHLSQILKKITPGTHVKRGDTLGYSGISGPAHLHFGMHAEYNVARVVGLPANQCANWTWPSWLPRDTTAENGSPLASS